MADIINFLPPPPPGAAEKIIEAWKLLPAWFIPRMMTGVGAFGLLMQTSQILCIETITNVRQGSHGDIWIDVNMLTAIPDACKEEGWVIIAPTSRTEASIQASKIIAAFELADT